MSDVPIHGLPVNGTQFRIGGVLAKSFSVYWRQFWKFLLLGLMPLIPMLIYGLLLGLHVVSIDGYRAISNWLTAPQSFLQLSAEGAAVYGTFQTLQGQPFVLSQSLTIGFRRLLVLVGTSILVALAWFFAALLLVVPGIIVGCMLYVAVPVSVLERRGVFGSLGRSAELTKGHRWAIFGLGLLVFAAAILFFVVCMIPLIGVLGHRPQEPGAAALVLIGLSTLIFGAVLMVFVGIFAIVLVTVVYYELRAMKEGVGPASLATVFD